jgi:group I intron endonuclease
MEEYYVYLTTNNINGKRYIGKHHGELNDSYLGSGENLIAAVKKYGKENFSKEILYIATSEADAYNKEAYYIELFNAVESPDFYNISPGNNYSATKKFVRDRSYTKTPEYRQRMSEACRGEKNGMYGRHHTEEAKKKMSEHSKGLVAGEKNGMYGKSKDKALNGKWVEMYDENHNYIKTFKAKTAVLDFLQLKGHTDLDKAIKNGTLYKGYYWKQVPKVKESVETKKVEA